MSEIGTRLRQTRKARGWTQLQLEAASGVDQGIITNIERGHTPNPTAQTMQKLADALDTTVDALLTGAPVDDLTIPPRALLEEAGYTAKLIDDLVESWPRQSHAVRLKVVTAARRRVQEARDLYSAIL